MMVRVNDAARLIGLPNQEHCPATEKLAARRMRLFDLPISDDERETRNTRAQTTMACEFYCARVYAGRRASNRRAAPSFLIVATPVIFHSRNPPNQAAIDCI
jgi:hypothetical protein